MTENSHTDGVAQGRPKCAACNDTGRIALNYEEDYPCDKCLSNRDGLNRQARNPAGLPDGNPASASAERASGDDIIDHRRQVGMPRDLAAQPPAAPVETGRNRDPIHAPDGRTWYQTALDEASKRGANEQRIHELEEQLAAHPNSSADNVDELLIRQLREIATEFAIDNKTDCKIHVCWVAAERLAAQSQASSADCRRDEIVAGAFYKTRGDKNNLPHIVGPLEHDLNDGDAPWKARVYDQIWKWGYDGLANADGTPHNRDLVERVYRPTHIPNEPQEATDSSAADWAVACAVLDEARKYVHSTIYGSMEMRHALMRQINNILSGKAPSPVSRPQSGITPSASDASVPDRSRNG